MKGKIFITKSGLKIYVIYKTIKSDYCCLRVDEDGHYDFITLTIEELNKLKEME